MVFFRRGKKRGQVLDSAEMWKAAAGLPVCCFRRRLREMAERESGGRTSGKGGWRGSLASAALAQRLR